MDLVTRREFVVSLGAAQLALLGLTPEKPVYVCPPCGCASDKIGFNAPGACPSCGMQLVLKGAAAGTARLSLDGSWAGSYGAGSGIVPIAISIASKNGGATATFDLSGFDGGYDVNALSVSNARLSGNADTLNGVIAFDASVHNDGASGTARLGTATQPLALQRIVPLNLALARKFEGAYRTSSGIVLVEHVFGEIFAMNEQPAGTARILFPVAEDEFVCGHTLFAAAPAWRRIRFAQDAAGTFMVISQDGNEIRARRIPLRMEPVTFESGSVRLAGTLILPEDGKPQAAYVFTHGSGPATRSSFSGLGILFATKGVAALKYDKRGTGESTGVFATASFEDLANDAAAGAQMLAARFKLDRARVGFWGLSQGSAVAPLAASRSAPRAPVIAASGGGVSIDEWSLLEGEAQLRSDGRFSDADISEALQFERLRDRYWKSGTGWAEYAAARAIAVTKKWYGYPTTDLFGPKTPDSEGWKLERQFYFYDPAPALSTLRGRFLGLFGENDPASSGSRNLDGLRKGLAASQDVTLRVIPKADHNLFESATPNASELPKTRRFIPKLFDEISDWAAKAH